MDEPPAKAARRTRAPDSPGDAALLAARAPSGPATLSLLDLPEEVLAEILDRVVVRTVGGSPRMGRSSTAETPLVLCVLRPFRAC
jgi:hypothetical protein